MKKLAITFIIFPIYMSHDHLPAMVNAYDPQLAALDPDRWGHNCMEPCNRTANGLLITAEHYGKIAACPPQEMGCFVTFSNEDGEHGPYQCMDTGGALLEPRMYDGELVQYYDVLWDFVGENGQDTLDIQPWWSHQVFNVKVECN